ncbi:MAG: carbohydrate ABC transporter permease [Actinobacteria bacterium]|nr:carbohydrate ABC transporter permease [Actinomycetota bacterium]
MNTLKRKVIHFILNIMTWVIVFIVIFPLVWMFLSSIKQPGEVYAYPPILFSRRPTLLNYIELFKVTNFEKYFINSIIVTLSTVVITMITVIITTYSLTRFRIWGGNVLSRLYVIIYLIPHIVMIIPIFLMMKTFHLLNNLFSLIITYLIFTFPYSYLLMRAYIGSIDPSIEEAALIDGASRIGAFVKVLLPVAVPGIVATSIFTAILCWNEYLFALVLVPQENVKTLTVGVAGLTEKTGIPSWGMLMAAAVVVVLPMIIFFVIVQRKIVIGLSAGAVKG